ncbi:MAG: hypothetical protein V4710_11075 [Verrucomicrobiota bacterium]
MADKTVTPSSVLASSAADVRRGVAGVAIAAGQSLYKDTSDNTMKLYDANGVAPANVFAGISQHAAAVGQPISFVYSDPSFTPGFAVAAGEVLIGSATPGGIAVVADIASGLFVTILGIGIGSNKVKLDPVVSGVAAV